MRQRQPVRIVDRKAHAEALGMGLEAVRDVVAELVQRDRFHLDAKRRIVEPAQFRERSRSGA